MDILKDRKDIAELSELYVQMQEKAKSAGQELAQREKDDDAFGAPNKKKKAKRWWDDDGDGKGYEKHEVKGKFKKEEVVLEKQKDTPDQVKAVIAYDKARKGTDDATYDSEHGKKKQAKKERDYAKWQRDKGAEDAQKSGHPWEHAKGSTREKEGKKSVKHAHIKDSFSDWRTDLREIIATDVEDEKEIKEKKVKNKVVIDPELKLEAVAEDLGAELVSVEEVDGLGKPELQEKDLNAAERRALPDKDFALPGKGKGPEGKQAGSYPIPDKSHARMALAMVAKHGTSEKKAKVRAAVAKKFPGIKQEEVQVEAKVDVGKSADEKATARNQRNNPKKGDPGFGKFATSVFIKRKEGQSLAWGKDSAASEKRREAHAKKRGVKEDKAFDNVVAQLRAKHGKDAVLTKDSPKPKPQKTKVKTKPQKPLTDAEKNQREVDAQYGRTPWNPKGSLGT